jgi:twitching motility protein PilT
MSFSSGIGARTLSSRILGAVNRKNVRGRRPIGRYGLVNEIRGALRDALQAVVQVNGTDLVLTMRSAPMIRLDGSIRPVEGLPATDEALMQEYLRELLDGDQHQALERDRDVDFAFSFGPHRFRGNVFYQRGLPAVSLRLIQQRIPTFDEIGLPASVQELIHLKQGLILFCGPTGSGKSTSMATLVDAINQARPCHIITIEDPIEYLHENRTAVVHQREVGIDAQSFARALRAALREDPDVVLVGEMRDPESIAITLTLAETGHLVLSSLHTNDAPQTLDRIVDVFPSERQGQIRQQLASTLSAVVAQRLVPRVGAGLVAAYEVLLGTQPVTNLVREGKVNQLRNAMQIALGAGHKTLEMSLNELCAAGIISTESALATAFVPHEIESANQVSPLLAQPGS